MLNVRSIRLNCTFKAYAEGTLDFACQNFDSLHSLNKLYGYMDIMQGKKDQC